MNFEDEYSKVVIILGLALIIIGGSLIGFNIYSSYNISKEAIKAGLIQKIERQGNYDTIIWVKPIEKLEK